MYLRDAGIEIENFDSIVGTSVGTINEVALLSVGLDGTIDIWNNIKSEVKAKSSFGEHASLIRISFYPDFINVKVYDSGYDLYETEIIKFTNEQGQTGVINL